MVSKVEFSFSQLPNDAISTTLLFLDARALGRITTVSKEFRKFVREELEQVVDLLRADFINRIKGEVFGRCKVVTKRDADLVAQTLDRIYKERINPIILREILKSDLKSYGVLVLGSIFRKITELSPSFSLIKETERLFRAYIASGIEELSFGQLVQRIDSLKNQAPIALREGYPFSIRALMEILFIERKQRMNNLVATALRMSLTRDPGRDLIQSYDNREKNEIAEFLSQQRPNIIFSQAIDSADKCRSFVQFWEWMEKPFIFEHESTLGLILQQQVRESVLKPTKSS